jgi:hypothetical protein
MKLTKQKLKQIIKEELEEAYGGASGPFPDRYGDAHKQRAGLAPDELENFLDTYVVDNPLYSLDGETSKSLFAGYVKSMGAPTSVQALQDMYDSLARNMDPEDRSHMSDLMEVIKEELKLAQVRRGHPMYKTDDELREIGANIGNMLEMGERVINHLSEIQARYGEMAHMGTYATSVQKAAQTLSDKYRDALDELSRSTERGWYDENS